MSSYPFGSRFEYPSDTLRANDRSDAGDHGDDHSHIIGIGDELIYTMWSGLRLGNATEGVQTRVKMMVRRKFHIFPTFCGSSIFC